ncbi:homeobox KN domain-containing protein [Gigaspora rosea]|uniref:Homeobox KN domain-containing protein n=1 Tax=Gigaspora rosea TaxID=44941 RepID=A0A397UMT2_9GLOM|nr:homeobox KN domain-containing protein [Gigaspora rosea]
MSDNRRLRVFCPKILFHEHPHPIPRNEPNYFNPTYYYRGEDYLRWRERVENMMNRNSRIWMYENGGDVYLNGDLTPQSLPTSPVLNNTFYNHRIVPHQGPQVIDGTFVTVGPKKRRGNLPKATTALLKDWLARHKKHPYPTEEEKQGLAKKTMLNLQQISNWFINARRRHLPLMLNSANAKGSTNDLDIYTYKTAEKAEDTTEVKSTRCHTAKACSRIQMNGAIKKPKHTCRGRRST